MPNLCTFLSQCRKLEHLSLKNCQIDDTAFALIIERLYHMSFVAELNLAQNKISDHSVAHQFLSWICSGYAVALTVIDFQSNQIRGFGA